MLYYIIFLRKSQKTVRKKSESDIVSEHGSLTVEYKKKCLQSLWYLLFYVKFFALFYSII